MRTTTVLLAVFFAAPLCSLVRAEELVEGAKGLKFMRVFVSPDGQHVGGTILVDGSFAGALMVFDRAKRSSQTLNRYAGTAVFSPTGKEIMAGGTCYWAGWEYPSLEKVFTIEGCPEALRNFGVQQLAVSPTEQIAVTHDYSDVNDLAPFTETKVILWHVRLREKKDAAVYRQKGREDPPLVRTTFSASGKYLACHNWAERTLKVLDLDTEDGEIKEKATIKNVPAGTMGLGFSKDEKKWWCQMVIPQPALFRIDIDGGKNAIAKVKLAAGAWPVTLMPEDTLLVARTIGEAPKRAELQVIRLEGGEVLLSKRMTQGYSCMALSLDKRWFAGGSAAGGIYVTDLQDWLKTLKK